MAWITLTLKSLSSGPVWGGQPPESSRSNGWSSLCRLT